ncbi:DUF1292 domain-containing protein [Ornithinibacillus sp. BX22]|uniref:DUF1292 domain-containing protein n=2 Tax=Ornithinibacillus TaxID=484508 RepID=A0A923L7H5_9BACI|nr:MULTISPECIES: DUF1292 domain-containing protein [Ornithinibacillus]MBC5637968.1 DUF1292 domain-containing protein [Ornithinibacillus hominis]MBS3681856.1 DUF1292 domain-containing protein [Ornithinibacillus massiliensis]
MDPIEVGEVFTISDEEQEESEVEVIAKVTLQGTDYVAVSFVEDLKEETEEDIDIFFLKLDADGELSAIETDEEFDQVSEAFDAIIDE